MFNKSANFKRQLVVSPSEKFFTTFCRYQLLQKAILNVAEFLNVSLQTSTYTNTSPVSCGIQSLFFEMRLPLSKVLCYYGNEMKLFYQSRQLLFRAKITCKRAIFSKSEIRFGYVCHLQFLLSQFSSLINLQVTC